MSINVKVKQSSDCVELSFDDVVACNIKYLEASKTSVKLFLKDEDAYELHKKLHKKYLEKFKESE